MSPDSDVELNQGVRGKGTHLLIAHIHAAHSRPQHWHSISPTFPFSPFLAEMLTASVLVLEMGYTGHRKKLMHEAHLNRSGTYTK